MRDPETSLEFPFLSGFVGAFLCAGVLYLNIFILGIGTTVKSRVALVIAVATIVVAMTSSYYFAFEPQYATERFRIFACEGCTSNWEFPISKIYVGAGAWAFLYLAVGLPLALWGDEDEND